MRIARLPALVAEGGGIFTAAGKTRSTSASTAAPARLPPPGHPGPASPGWPRERPPAEKPNLAIGTMAEPWFGACSLELTTMLPHLWLLLNNLPLIHSVVHRHPLGLPQEELRGKRRDGTLFSWEALQILLRIFHKHLVFRRNRTGSAIFPPGLMWRHRAAGRAEVWPPPDPRMDTRDQPGNTRHATLRLPRTDPMLFSTAWA